MAKLRNSVPDGRAGAESTDGDGTATGSTSPNGEGLLVAIDPNAPWAAWPRPVARPTTGSEMRAALDNTIMPSGGERIVLVDGDGIIGYPTDGGLRDLSTRVGFPLDFIQTLPLGLQVDCINAKLDKQPEMPFTAITQPYMVAAPQGGSVMPHPDGLQVVANISPGWRGFVSHPEVAQTAYNICRSVYDEVSTPTARYMDSGMELRLASNFSMEVTAGGRSVGDVVSAGLHITHRYGMELAVSLYIERLVCTNGMTTTRSGFEWKQRAMGTPQAQIEWLMYGIAQALSQFEDVVAKLQRMAATPLNGDMEAILLERARAMRLPRSYDNELLAAWRQEPMQNEYGMLNAFTRMATHGDGLSASQRHRLQATAGHWAESYDIVNARLPRPLAEAVGATIVLED